MKSHLELYEMFDPQLRASVESFLSYKHCRLPEQHVVGVVNKAWDKIFNSFGQARDPDQPYGWMWTIAKHIACEHLRQCIREEDFPSQERKTSNESGAEKLTFDPPELIPSSEVILKILLADEILRKAVEISSELPELLYRRLEEGLDWRAIAELKGENCASLRSRYNRMLKKLLKRVLTDEEMKRLLEKGKGEEG